MKENTHNRQLVRLFDSLDVSVVLLSDPDSVSYAAGIELPFAGHFPGKPLACLLAPDRDDLLICPYEWSRAAVDQAWEGRIETYPDSHADPFGFLANAVGGYFRENGLEAQETGFEEHYLSAALLGLLKKSCPDLRWTPVDGELGRLRMIKSDREVELLQTAAEQLEFGLIGALQHLEGSLEENGYTLPEFCERIRVHVYETGGTAGGLAAAAAGDGTAVWYHVPRGKFIPGELVRVEASSRYLAYWACTSRMMSIGETTELQKRAYAENLLLKRRAIELLNPGVKASTVFEAVAEIAASKGIDFRGEFGIGRGIGASESEAPSLDPSDDTPLAEGMCINLAVYTEGPRKELICVKDTYVITSNGPRCISSYHNWDRVYAVTGFRSAH
ncbi:MAG: M24 family metallopeptidase [Spirochaetota bacterium]|nr:M24 family metallopeptidase [Spirochaetota bacterium]